MNPAGKSSQCRQGIYDDRFIGPYRQITKRVHKYGSLQGKNDFGRIGYNGPCPPPGKAHKYFFKVYALDATLSLKSGATRSRLEAAMSGHILAQGEMIGKYRR